MLLRLNYFHILNFQTKKLALLKERLAHEKNRNEALQEKSEKQLKELKDKHNKETAKIEVRWLNGSNVI